MLRTLCLLAFPWGALGGAWPYTRTFTNSTVPADEHNESIPNLFIKWLNSTLTLDPTSEIAHAFVNRTIPADVQSFHDLEKYLVHHHVEPHQLPDVVWDAIPPNKTLTHAEEVAALFSHLNYQLEPDCTAIKEKFWYRLPDGSCNWLKQGQTIIGSTFQPRSRDFGQTTYADGISAPRHGPNPREVSNAFFKRKERLYYEHTPLMLGLVEFIMHDVTYSSDSTTEYIDVPIPTGDPAFDPYHYGNASFRVWRTQAADGTGTDKSNPRQHANGATAWLDGSALYGSTPKVVEALRSHVNGKLKSQRGKDGYEYLPFNTEGLPVRTRPGVDIHNLFLGGDVRTNEDWIMLSVHTLLLREHNRLCDIMVALHPDWDDERVYQTVKLVMGAKIALMGNSYQMAYWSDKMPWPRDDGFPLYRAIYGESVLSINPFHAYPWPLVTRDDRPMVTSAEMSIVYRFHEFIIQKFPIKDERNKTLQELSLFNTAFDAKGFLDLGADKILRGMLASDIPNFKSGVEEDFRSAGRYRGTPFDIVTWSVVHEREQGLPTFNQYWRAFALMTPKPYLTVKIRKTFEDFSSDPKMVAELKRLYKTPDDVDFVVGVQLEEELFPGTTMPVSALIPSLFSLFGVGNSDRFSPGFAAMRCFLVDKPWNCHPSNAFEELLWEPKPSKTFPNARWVNTFWMQELDFQAHGTNLLWRLITENSGAKCVQKNPLFPFDPHTNPILCELEPPTMAIPWNIILGTVAALALGILIIQWFRIPRNTPPTTSGFPIIGVGKQLQADPKGFLVSQARKYGRGKTFGLRLVGSLVYYISSAPPDLEAMMNDELRASFHALAADTNLGAVVGRHNFAEELHASVIRKKLETERSETLPRLAEVVSGAVDAWLAKNRLSDTADIGPALTNLMAYVMSRVCLGSVGFDDPELLNAYLGLNSDSGIVFGVSNLLPSFIGRIFSDLYVHKHYATIKKKILPVIHLRRKYQKESKESKSDKQLDDILGFFLDGTDDDNRVAELVAGIVIGGLINVSIGVTNALYDIVSVPHEHIGLLDLISGDHHARNLQKDITTSAPAHQFVPDQTGKSTWNPLRSAVLESLRLSACIFGPVRKIIVDDFKLASDPGLVLPRGSGFAASPYLVHYDDQVYPHASRYVYDRFAGQGDDAPTGTPKYLTFGLPPHTCPGRFFAIQTVSIALNSLLKKYHFEAAPPPAGDKYTYDIGQVVMPRKPVPLRITPL
jgi:peroxidase